MKKLKFGSECITCVLERFLSAAPCDAEDETKDIYIKRLLKLLYEAKEDDNAPLMVSKIYALQKELFGFGKDYSEVKKHFNLLMMKKEGELSEKIQKAEDPLKKALSFALVGNYIDFGAMSNVSEEELMGFFDKEEDISESEYNSLKEDLLKAERLVYLTDNCGEILLDKLFIKEIKKLNPNLSLTAIVRGDEVLNDATIKDANEVGLSGIAKVIENGNSVPGTHYKALSFEAKKAFYEADVIISKGQGNFETLAGQNKNIYYIFMCKCNLFTKCFNVPRFTGMLINELR